MSETSLTSWRLDQEHNNRSQTNVNPFLFSTSDWSLQSSAISCLIIGLLLLSASLKFPWIVDIDDRDVPHKSNGYLPLKDTRSWNSPQSPSSASTSSTVGTSFTVLLLQLLATIIAICMRIEIIRRTFSDRRCAIAGLEVRISHSRTCRKANGQKGLLLVLLAIWTYCTPSTGQPPRIRTAPFLPGSFRIYVQFALSNAPLLCMAAAARYASQLKSLPRSSLICSASDRTAVVVFQSIGVGLDLFLLLTWNNILSLERPNELLGGSWRLNYTSFAFLVRCAVAIHLSTELLTLDSHHQQFYASSDSRSIRHT